MSEQLLYQQSELLPAKRDYTTKEFDDELFHKLLENVEAAATSRPTSLYHQPPKAAEKSAAERLARRLYYLEGFRLKDVSKHLIKRNEFSQLVAEEYFRHFDFTGLTLDNALREFFCKFTLLDDVQDRERVLSFFSLRYMFCNPHAYENEEACHILSCALMLLNSELHDPHTNKKMTCDEFILNVSAMSNGHKFVCYELRDLYNSIRENNISCPHDSDGMELTPQQMYWMNLNAVNKQRHLMAAEQRLLNEVPDKDKPREYMRGFVVRKCLMESFGKKIRKLRRCWKPFYARLRGLNLYLYRSTDFYDFETTFSDLINANCVSTSNERLSQNFISSFETNGEEQTCASELACDFNDVTSSTANEFVQNRFSNDVKTFLTSDCINKRSHLSNDGRLGSMRSWSMRSLPEPEAVICMSHSITWKATDYVKKEDVFHVRTKDGQEYLFQTYGSIEMEHWIVQLNFVAAVLSAPVLSSAIAMNAFHRPTLPETYTTFAMYDQLNHHMMHLTFLYAEKQDLLKNKPTKRDKGKTRSDYDEKLNYLEEELSRYKTYAQLLELRMHGLDSIYQANGFAGANCRRLLDNGFTVVPESNVVGSTLHHSGCDGTTLSLSSSTPSLVSTTSTQQILYEVL